MGVAGRLAMPGSQQQGWAERSHGGSGQCWTKGPHLETWGHPTTKHFGVFATFFFHCHFKVLNCCKC